jgi:WD40 repeat protein
VGKCFNAVYKQPITCLRIVGALIIVSNEDGNILFWNRNNLNCEAILTCHDSPINSIAYHNQRLFTASDDKLIKEWDLRTLTCIRQMRAHYGPVLSVLALDNLIISSGSDRTIVWNLKNNLLK